MSDLFRREAVSHATQRLSGAVVLATPLSVRVLGLFFGGIVLAAVIFVSMATYARKATVTGWLVPDQGLIRATASSAGFIQGVFVKEGDAVEKGARLAEIRIGADTAAGNVGDMVIQQLRAEAEATRARARAQIDRLSAESEQASANLAKQRTELSQLQTQYDLQAQRLQLARQELARGEDLASRGNIRHRGTDIGNSHREGDHPRREPVGGSQCRAAQHRCRGAPGSVGPVTGCGADCRVAGRRGPTGIAGRNGRSEERRVGKEC